MKRLFLVVLLLVGGISSIAFGCYTAFFEKNGYESVSAVITKIDEYEIAVNEDNTPEYQYDVYVKYRVNDQEYDGKLDYFEDGYKKGKEIQIFYDPSNPEKIHGDSKNFGIYLIVVGLILIISSGLALIRRR